MTRPEESGPAAVDALWREHRHWVAAVLLAHMPRGGDLEDLLQEVGMTLVRAVHTIKDARALRPWLRSVAINAARSLARRERLKQRRIRPLLEDDDQVADPAQRRDLERDEARGLAEFVLDILQRLHSDYREPLVLRCVQGLSQKQIAEALGLPETTIETRLSRGRRMLRHEIANANDPRFAQEKPR